MERTRTSERLGACFVAARVDGIGNSRCIGNRTAAGSCLHADAHVSLHRQPARQKCARAVSRRRRCGRPENGVDAAGTYLGAGSGLCVAGAHTQLCGRDDAAAASRISWISPGCQPHCERQRRGTFIHLVQATLGPLPYCVAVPPASVWYFGWRGKARGEGQGLARGAHCAAE